MTSRVFICGDELTAEQVQALGELYVAYMGPVVTIDPVEFSTLPTWRVERPPASPPWQNPQPWLARKKKGRS